MSIKRLCRRIVTALVIVVALACLPARALAADKDYRLTATNIWATVHPSGTVSVIEERTLDLDGNFHGFYWDIDTSAGELGDVSVHVTEAGEVTDDGSLTPYRMTDKGSAEGTWTTEKRDSSVRVDVHFDKYNELATFYVSYDINGVTACWSDTSELYWKLVGDRWEKASHNVSCYVLFEGAEEGSQVVAGQNLRGWLHNASLSGTIEVPSGTVKAWNDTQAGDPGTLVIRVPVVEEGDFAEVRAAFPTSWLKDAKPRSAKRLDTILGEEDKWASAANERIESAQRWASRKIWFYTILAGINILLAIVTAIDYRRDHKARFDDKYFRDAPTDDHPAVLSYVYKGTCGDGPDFTASLMRLTDLGALTLEKTVLVKERLIGKSKEEDDFILTIVPEKAKTLTDPLDKATMDFVSYVASKAHELNSRKKLPKGSVRMSEFELVAQKHAEDYQQVVDTWKEHVKKQVDLRQLDKDEQDNMSGISVLLLFVDLLAIVIGVFDLFVLSEDALELVGAWTDVLMRLVLLFICSAVFMIAWGSRPDRSSEAVEIKAQLDSLKRWLKDFTKLGEAVPNDVVLWNRLLVMAVVLGVSDRVIEQLKLALPEVVASTGIDSAMLWCDAGLRGNSPADAFSQGFSSATSAASSSGSGGGASGGGGGGGGAY
ncbi:MAG: DUF2207 domain-containing protein [Atopobiaceae bacterium]|nr:DUF2207 domain-containing protein [Atopobiaceae bacterium]